MTKMTEMPIEYEAQMALALIVDAFKAEHDAGHISDDVIDRVFAKAAIAAQSD